MGSDKNGVRILASTILLLSSETERVVPIDPPTTTSQAISPDDDVSSMAW
jgi:hypothetical protein